MLGLADFVQRFQNELSQRPVQLAFAVEQGIAKAQADIQQSFKDFRAQFSVEPLEAALGKSLQSPDEAARALVETKSKAAALRAEFDAAMASREKAQQAIASTAEAVSASLDKITKRSGADPDAMKAVDAFKKALADPGLTKESLQPLVGAVDPLIEKLSLLSTKFGGVVNAQSVNDFAAALQGLSQRAEAIKTLQMPLPDTTRLQQFENVIRGLQNMPSALNGIGPAIEAGVAPSAAIRQNMLDAARAAASMSGGAVNKAFGGPIYRASGGAVGTDVIPAMLSPGEFVMSSSATRRFASQLVAMNAGVTPVFHDGGYVDNSVGDVKITVNESSTPRATAEAIHNMLRRAERRKTIR